MGMFGCMLDSSRTISSSPSAVLGAGNRVWVELGLATPVCLYSAWPFYVRAWRSLVNRSLNMFTLIGLGVVVAYGYSLVAAIAPDIFPAQFRTHGGEVAVYFEAAATIVTLIPLGQVLELRARSQTGRSSRSWPCMSGRVPPSAGMCAVGTQALI